MGTLAAVAASFGQVDGHRRPVGSALGKNQQGTALGGQAVRLLYTAQAEGTEPIAKAVERLQTVERLVKQKIVIKESRGRWRPSLQDDTW